MKSMNASPAREDNLLGGTHHIPSLGAFVDGTVLRIIQLHEFLHSARRRRDEWTRLAAHSRCWPIAAPGDVERKICPHSAITLAFW
jgi:hypothetical protein